MWLGRCPSPPADVELIAQLKSRLQYAELKIRVLEEQLRLMRVEKYGAGGEKLYHVQMELFELGPMVGEVTVLGECECAPVRRSINGSYKHPGRQELPANLPCVERALPRAPDQRVCKSLRQRNGGDRYEESSRRDVKPAKYFVLVTKREKRACRSCENLGGLIGRRRQTGRSGNIRRRCLTFEAVLTHFWFRK
jgi:hypothetical protein